MKGHIQKTNKERSLTGQKKKGVPEPERVKAFNCPSWMPPLGREWWGKVAPQLLALNILTELDKGSFEATALAYGLMRLAAKQLLDDGFTIKGDRGGEKRHPASEVYKANVTIFQKGCERFGLDPMSRQRMDIKMPKKEKTQQEECNDKFRVVK